jgi:hypothetical protein
MDFGAFILVDLEAGFAIFIIGFLVAILLLGFGFGFASLGYRFCSLGFDLATLSW